MRKSAARILVAGLVLGGVAYALRPSNAVPPITGMVRSTEIRVAPEIGGHLAGFRVRSGDIVHSGDTLAELRTPELTAAVAEAHAAVGEARAARDRVYAGLRKEEVDVLAREIDKAQANLLLAQQQHGRVETLADHGNATRSDLDKAVSERSNAAAALAVARLRHAEATAGPTREELAAADAAVGAAEAAATVLEQRLAKAVLTAPCDCIVRVIVAEPGEAVRPGQPVLTLEPIAERWFAFNIREDRLGALTVGSPLKVRVAADQTIAARVTEVHALGEFATWRAARAVGDHDLNTFFIRADPAGETARVEAGMTVWLAEP
jgi:HlyD family secretion protein